MSQAERSNDDTYFLIIDLLATAMAKSSGASERRAPVWREEAKALVVRYLFRSRKTRLQITLVDHVIMIVEWLEMRDAKNTDFPLGSVH